MNVLQLTQTIHLLPTAQFGYKKSVDQMTLPGMEPEQEIKTVITNRQVAEALSAVADLVESQNGNPYRVRAYRNAARGILDLPEQAADMLERGEILPIPGLGPRLRMRIAELINTGDLTFYNDLHLQSLPSGVKRLMAVEHVGPRTAIRLYDELGIDTAEKLWWAARQQRIRHLPGFGERSEARLLEASGRLLKRNKRVEQRSAA